MLLSVVSGVKLPLSYICKKLSLGSVVVGEECNCCGTKG